MPEGVPVTPYHERFLRRVTNQTAPYPHLNECWIWNGTKLSSGYGIVPPTGTRKRMMAHRYSYLYTHGGDITPGEEIRHKCDVRACVNPDHLEVGTKTENMRDMISRGRGANRYGPHFNAEQVAEIRRRRGQGESLKQLGLAFGVHPKSISRICLGKHYRGLEQ